MPIRSRTRRVRISSAVAGVLVVICGWLGSANAAEPVSLRITTPEGEETRALAADTVVTSVMQGDGGTTASAKTFTRPAFAR